MQIDVILDTRARPGDLAELGRLAERHGLGGVALRLYANPADSIRLIGERVRPALWRVY